MKTVITLFFFLAFTFISRTNLHSQSRGLIQVQGNSFDIISGGDLGFSLISGDTSQNDTKVLMQNRSHEAPKINVRYGFNLNLGISPAIQIKTGVRYANPGLSVGKINAFDARQDINSIKKIGNIQGHYYRYNHQFIEIPMGIKYTLINSYCNPFMEIGVTLNRYLGTKVQETNDEGLSNTIWINEDFRTMNYFGFVSFGGDFYISRNITGFSQMVIRYQLNDLRNNEIVERLTGIGLEVGVRYHFHYHQRR